jgi:hypothetical protein
VVAQPHPETDDWFAIVIAIYIGTVEFLSSIRWPVTVGNDRAATEALFLGYVGCCRPIVEQ